MNNPYGIDDEDFVDILDLFKNYNTIEKVILYGSRARGDYYLGSDIDLCLVGENITRQELSSLRSDILNLELRYDVDILIYHRITKEALVKNIDKQGREIYNIKITSVS